MKLAPIVIFAYNRPEHLRRTIEALQKNILADKSALFIYCDGPKTEKDAVAVQAVRAYAKTVSGFQSVSIVYREKNYGLGKSIITGVTEVMQSSESVIVLEDDLTTSPFFLQFMNDALNLYKNTESVLSIHGFCYSINKEVPETFFLCDPGCLGWATWRRGWKLFEEDGRKLLKEITAKGLQSEFDYNNAYPYTRMLMDQTLGKNSSWAVRWYASAFLHKKLTLYPGKSLVEHIGFDNTGTNSGGCDPGQDHPHLQPINVTMIPLEENKLLRKYFSDYLWWWKYPRLQRLRRSLRLG